jgi:hypothetical protein
MRPSAVWTTTKTIRLEKALKTAKGEHRRVLKTHAARITPQ